MTRNRKKLTEIEIKNYTYYNFDDTINTEDFDPKNIKVDRKA